MGQDNCKNSLENLLRPVVIPRLQFPGKGTIIAKESGISGSSLCGSAEKRKTYLLKFLKKIMDKGR